MFVDWLCREPIGLAVLQLLEKGTLQKLFKRWWYDKGECVPDDTKVRRQNSNEKQTIVG